jgi:hypothetical protein
VRSEAGGGDAGGDAVLVGGGHILVGVEVIDPRSGHQDVDSEIREGRRHRLVYGEFEGAVDHFGELLPGDRLRRAERAVAKAVYDAPLGEVGDGFGVLVVRGNVVERKRKRRYEQGQ